MHPANNANPVFLVSPEEVHAGLPAKDETVKTTWNFENIVIPSLNQFFFLEYNKFTVTRNHEFKETDSIKFRTTVSEVLSFVGNPVFY